MGQVERSKSARSRRPEGDQDEHFLTSRRSAPERADKASRRPRLLAERHEARRLSQGIPAPASAATEDDSVRDKVELLVGKVGRAHGIRGDLTIDVRTDEPDRRFAPGTVFSARRGALTVASMKWHSSRLLVRFAEVPDRNAAESCVGPSSGSRSTRTNAPRTPRSSTTTSWWACGAHRGRPASETSIEVLHLPSQDMLVVRRRTPTDPMAPFPERVRADGGPRRRTSSSPTPSACLPTRRRGGGAPGDDADAENSSLMRLDVGLDLPRLPGTPGAVPARQGPRVRPSSTCVSTTSAAGPTTGITPSTTPRTAAGRAWITHARAAAVRSVVDGAVAVVGPGAEIVDVQVDQSALARLAEQRELQRGEVVGEDRDDVDRASGAPRSSPDGLG